MKTIHKLTNNTIIYPNFHIWITDNSKLNILSNTPINIGDNVLINRTSFKINKFTRKPAPASFELEYANNISSDTMYYECLISKI